MRRDVWYVQHSLLAKTGPWGWLAWPCTSFRRTTRRRESERVPPPSRPCGTVSARQQARSGHLVVRRPRRLRRVTGTCGGAVVHVPPSLCLRVCVSLSEMEPASKRGALLLRLDERRVKHAEANLSCCCTPHSVAGPCLNRGLAWLACRVRYGAPTQAPKERADAGTSPRSCTQGRAVPPRCT